MTLGDFMFNQRCPKLEITVTYDDWKCTPPEPPESPDELIYDTLDRLFEMSEMVDRIRKDWRDFDDDAVMHALHQIDLAIKHTSDVIDG